MALASGLATFSSCDKAGSIPHFTRQFQSNPNDYTALMWRGRAYGIIGETKNAIQDFQSAGFVSRGPQKGLAEFHCACLEGQHQKASSILNTTVQNYQRCGEVWSEVGSSQFYGNKYDDALPNLKKAIDLGKEHRETGEPWYPWTNNHVGEIYYSKHDVDSACQYYNAATDSCDTLTIAHLGKSKCNVVKRRELEARESFEKASQLNRSLVHWRYFEAFQKDVTDAFEADSQYEGNEAGVTLKSWFFAWFERLWSLLLSGRSGGSRNYGGGGSNRGFGSGPNGGGGPGEVGRGGNGGDDGYIGDGNIWKKIQAAASTVKKHDDGRRFTKLGNFWLSRDKAGHASSFCKVYIEKGSTIDFIGSVPNNIFETRILENADYLENILRDGPNLEDVDMIPKHESRYSTKIKIRDLNVVR